MQARAAYVKIKYNNKDVSTDLAPYLESFVFTDNSDSQVDDITITVDDINGNWANGWYPTKGDTIEASIVVENWAKENDNRNLLCGTFEIDEITLSGMPRRVEIKAVATPDTGIKAEKRTKVWQKVTLSQIANDAAIRAGLKLFYDAPRVDLDRREQFDMTDLMFLREICKENSFSIKITDKQLIIFDEAAYESKPAEYTIKYSDDIGSFKFTSTSTDVYSSAQVVYHSPKSKKDHNFIYLIKGVKRGKRLVIHQRASSKAVAEKIAKAELRKANKNEVTADLTVTGDPKLQAAINVNLTGFGTAFDGKYFIRKCTHSLTNGYGVSLELHKAIGVLL